MKTKVLFRLILACALWSVPMAGATVKAQQATDTTTCLTVALKNGQTDRYWLMDAPTLSVADTLLEVKSDLVETVYALDDVKEFYLDSAAKPAPEPPEPPVPTAIENPITPIGFSFRYTQRDYIEVTGVNRVELFDLMGRPVRPVRAIGGKAEVSLSGLPTGVYILKTDNRKSVKIYKK